MSYEAPSLTKPKGDFIARQKKKFENLAAGKGFNEAQEDLEAVMNKVESFTKALKAHLKDCWDNRSELCADFKKEAKLAFSSGQAYLHTAKAELTPAFPLMLFVWTFAIGVLGAYSFFVTLPTDLLVAGLHGYVNFVFVAAAGIGTLMCLHGFMTRAAIKYYPEKLEVMWKCESYAWASSKWYMREKYLSVPHILAIGGMLLAITFVEVTAIAYVLPRLFAPSTITAPLASSAGKLLPAAVLLLVCMIAIRQAMPIDIASLYSGIISKPAFEAEFGKNTGRGAIVCFLGFGIGMLFLDGALFKAAWEFTDGSGLPANVDAQLLPVVDFIFNLVKIFFVPICFIGLSAIVGTVKRGLWLYPEYGKIGSTKPTYEMAAAAAYKEGKWKEFKKAKDRRTFLLFFCSTSVLIGVAVLIPLWAIFYFASSTVDAACDVRGTARLIDMATPDGEVTGAIADAVLEGGKWVSAKLGYDTTSYTYAQLGNFGLDVPKACDVADGVNFWMLTMFFGLFVHLPAAMSAWHLLNRYTTIMHIKDVLAGRVAPDDNGNGNGKALF